MNAFDLSAYGDLNREDLRLMARTSETAERYEDMCKFMKSLVEKLSTDDELTVEERNLLSVAYKNVIGACRASWRTLHSEEHKNEALIKKYRTIVEEELEGICNEVLKLLQDHLIPASQSKQEVESQVFYLKMTGDYYRYLAEFKPDAGHPENAKKYYQQALDIATDSSNPETALAPTHPIRLGLALNFSVCYYEILQDPSKACELAKQAFDDAIAKLDHLDDASYKDSTLIMQLLRDNLTLWTQDNTDNPINDDE